MTITLYGISNCDTVRKARRWLDDEGIDYRFHDFRQDGLEEALVKKWLSSQDWDKVINRRSTSWKALSVQERESMDAQKAAAAALASPTLIKRPVLESEGVLAFGFSESRYAALLK
ncbi:ArsC family reductase [Congregibacter litoralis]|uniref:Transcriptional regulator, Spx/MgsR family n=1 Tax=Congregibacter litoralis KT71 TaxID=314285 RepID=A4ACI6_9GAMM|nr:ArsC family reductase [Congregibacter litoralis]EAQ96200.1 transcriptional regulator, Spx/MgsR family [Congregibacter litoralis KT71]